LESTFVGSGGALHALINPRAKRTRHTRHLTLLILIVTTQNRFTHTCIYAILESMNIFYLSHNPKQAAEFHLDKHVVKMILETAQLLCTAHRILDGTVTQQSKLTKTGKSRSVKRYVLSNMTNDAVMYQATHINHPCAIWARDSINNYMWLYELFVALCDEYTFRYGKKHKTDTLLRDILKTAPVSISHSSFTLPAQAMPPEYRNSDPVVAYQQYYIGAKSKFARWTKRPTPPWFISNKDTHANV